jgi:hypothetical protein
LRIDVGDEHVLHKVNAPHLLNHHHDLRGITAAPEWTHQDIDDLAQNIVKDVERFLLNIVEDQVPLVLRTSGDISNARSHGGMEEVVEAVELWQEVLSRRRVGYGSRSVHEEHLLLAQSPIGVDSSLHGVLVLHLVSHPQDPLTISMKIQSGVELVDDFLILVILVAHHLGQLQLLTCFLEEIELLVAPGGHPLPIDPLSLQTGFLFEMYTNRY